MLGSMLWVLRQRRYQALAVAAVLLAIGCAVAGTWQVNRFNASVRDNDALRANAHAAAVPLSTDLVPLTGAAPAPARDSIRYRTVTVSGTYLRAQQSFLPGQDDTDDSGFYVLTPFRTAAGVLIVARGFVRATGAGTPPADVATPPAGTVRISGRLQTADTGSDGYARLGHAIVATVNPAEQAARLGAPVYDAYLALLPKQPGGTGLAALPAPDLTNPAGGAYEWQHFAYILQWYVFGLLALAMPFVFARHEVREARKQYLGIDPGAEQYDAEPPALPGPSGRPELTSAPDPAGTLATRDGPGELARRDGPTPEQWRRAQVLADRYGRSLGPDGPPGGPGSPGRRSRLVRRRASEDSPVAGSAREPFRSEGDPFHGAYNDYLWELALADGDMPDVLLSPDGPVDPRAVADTSDRADRADTDYPTPEPRYVSDDQPEVDR